MTMRTLLAAAALLALTLPVFAEDAICLPPDRTIAEDKAAALADGDVYLGLRTLPFTDQQAVFYIRKGQVILSFQRDGCVASVAHGLGPYVPGQGI